MYSQGSIECLKNSKSLFRVARMSLQQKYFGIAQSLTVTAIEEAGKAIILELANLNYFEKEVVKNSMYDHRPKKLLFLAIEKGLLFVEQLDRRQHESVIDRSLIQELENTLKHSLNDLEKETKRILCAS